MHSFILSFASFYCILIMCQSLYKINNTWFLLLMSSELMGKIDEQIYKLPKWQVLLQGHEQKCCGIPENWATNCAWKNYEVTTKLGLEWQVGHLCVIVHVLSVWALQGGGRAKALWKGLSPIRRHHLHPLEIISLFFFFFFKWWERDR